MPETPVTKPDPKTARRAWVTPRVDRINAGQAELGTRATGDGAFSTS